MNIPLTPTASAIDPDTLQAYRATEYRVQGDPPFTLCIGEHSLPLAELHAARRAASSAFITACNPRSTLLSEIENAQRQALLAAELEEAGYAFLSGLGVDPTGDWPGESSFLVLDIGREAARTLSRQFNQNSLLWAGTDAVPQLLLLR